MISDRLFVYGTLMRGFDHPMAQLLSRSADFIGEAKCRGRLYLIKHYPGLVLSDDANDIVFLVAIGGGYGTVSEIAFALLFKRPVFLLEDAPTVEGATRCANPDEALEQVARAVLRLPALGAA